MINMSTYARDIELKRFALINESSEMITEDADPLSGVLAAKSGTGTDQEATTAWNQLKNDVVAKVNANPPVYTGTLNLTVKGVQVPVEWKVAEDTGIVSYTNTATKFTATGSKGAPAAPAAGDQAKPAAPKPAAQPANPAKFDDLTLKLLKAMQDMGTDEEGITDVFTGIKSQDEFTKFAQYFGSLKMGYNTYGAGNVTDFAKFKSEAANRKYTNDCSLAYWIGQELDTDEVNHLNTLLKSNGIGSQFQAL
jgi:hypothetical protein